MLLGVFWAAKPPKIHPILVNSHFVVDVMEGGQGGVNKGGLVEGDGVPAAGDASNLEVGDKIAGSFDDRGRRQEWGGRAEGKLLVL